MTNLRDPDLLRRIEALGKSKVNPDVDRAMRGIKGKRPKVRKKKKKIQGRSTAEKMDRGERL